MTKHILSISSLLGGGFAALLLSQAAQGDPVKTLVDRLDLQQYKATIKGLTQYMTHTDSEPFMDLIPAISLRENERGREIGAGWDPNWHQPTDVYATFSEADFRLGLNAAQTTLGAIGRLSGATVVTP